MKEQFASGSAPSDVRMRGFARRWTVDDMLAWLDAHVSPVDQETVALADAGGRMLAEEVVSAVDVPGFERSMMDGYAVRASDTMGATAYNRLPLKVVDEILPGRRSEIVVQPGQAARIMTGAPMPRGADAVLPAEKTELDGDLVLACDAVSPEKHVGRRGEDIRAGTIVLAAGRCLRPQDLGVLSSIGVGQVAVVRQPRVRIVVTGNELLPPGSAPEGCQVVDANSPMLDSLVRRDGGIPRNPGIVTDDPHSILDAMRDDVDVVLVSGGSSVGQEDHAPRLLAEHGELTIHGIAMRPSSPAGLGTLDGRIVFLLPGNPVSCLCAYDFFAGRAIRQLGGRTKEWPYRSRRLPLGRKLVSPVGRVDYARVAVENGEVQPLAISGASVLSSTTRAAGFVVIPSDSEGFPQGSEVDVFLYD